MKTNHLSVLLGFFGVAASASAATLVSLPGFGGGDGWRAPNEVLAGDTAGTASGGNYSYLQGSSLERGMAFNPVTGNLVLVSRSAVGNGIRVLSGSTGADIGFLNQGIGIISGGTFAVSAVGISTDGSIFAGNLTTNASTTNYKVYQWATEAAAAPTTFFNSAITSSVATRLGDSLDVFGPAASVSVVAGAGTAALGYATITSGGATRIETFTPSVATGDFRLGITYTASASDVWGKQTGSALRETTTSGSLTGSPILTSAGETAMDYQVIGSIPYLATIDANSSLVRVYDMSSPLTPVLSASFTTTSGALAANTNATGSVKWGATGPAGTTLYAMSTNQGIQALVFVPEPGTTLLGLMGLGLILRRRRN